jgi:hypothetical protein
VSGSRSRFLAAQVRAKRKLRTEIRPRIISRLSIRNLFPTSYGCRLV